MINTLKRKHYIIGGIVLLLLITNPSRNSFASFLHKTGLSNIGRDYNFLICSVYSQKEKDKYGDLNGKTYYLGIAGNFINITRD